MRCPDCVDEFEIIPSTIRTTDGVPLSPVEVAELEEFLSKCQRCNGTREVPDSEADWIKAGAEIRQLRSDLCIGMRAVADALEIKASEYLAIENGKKPFDRVRIEAAIRELSCL